MDISEFKRRRCSLTESTDEIFNEIERHSKEEKRIISVLENSSTILQNLDKTFEEKTALSNVDQAFLMFATMMQLVRIYLLPQYKEKFLDEDRLAHDDSIIKDMERDEIEEFKKKHLEKWKSKKSKKNYRGWQEIAFTIKVPYDATRHSGDGFFDRNMHGGHHRVKTLGHDPILGWIFGVCNIITDTITITPEYSLGEKKLPLPMLETYGVDMGSRFCWTERKSTASIFSNSIESIQEDWHRLYAAIFSQGLHLASDKFTKMGLPVPFLSTIAPETAYDLYKNGYDYLDLMHDTQLLRRSLKSAAYAMLINKLIAGVHFLFFNPSDDFDMKLYTVRTRKIVLYSNIIATTSDVIQTSFRAYCGDENALKNFDFGGFLVTLYRLVSDTAYIQKVKEEFIFNEWDRIIESENNICQI